ncbi:MAG: hypothetical protein ABEJ66_01900, partial [Candidatus Nanohaloarchaea archaeon]
MVDNEVRPEYVDEVLGALGAKDMSRYADGEEPGILVSKSHLEAVVAAERGEEELSLGNEILYLRDRGVLETAPVGDDIGIGIKHSQLSRPDRIVWEQEFRYPEEEPVWTDGPGE